jgi:Dolichyl-phosphate-mannose-protein mannosyltransferase
MRAASWRWPLALAALVVAAFALRAWGARQGLPYVYNADENSHFVPRAIGMFGHNYNPNYFINPPAFTYVLHALFFARWGTRDAVGDAFARDPTTAFFLARLASAALGAIAVGLLAWAGARLFNRPAGLVAGALLAVAFLPVHYGHFALNDAPALAPVCLALAGAAGIARGKGGTRDYVLAGIGIGLACATKYTAGVVALAVLGAALATGLRLRPLVLAAAVSVLAFLVANPYAVLDAHAFGAGLFKQSATASDGGGKLGLGDENPLAYYLRTLTWGFGWLPLAAALGGAVLLAWRDRAAALVLVPPPLLLLVFLGIQDRFFARWLLPVYPMLCLLAAAAAVVAATWLGSRVAWRPAAAVATVVAALLLCAQGVVFSVHNDRVLARTDTRQLARDWMERHIPEGEKIVVEPIAPDQWATDVGRLSAATGNGARWIKFPTSRSRVRNDGTLGTRSRVVKLEDYERTTRPVDLDRYRRAGFCWVVTGSTQYGRAFAEPGDVPQAIRYYDRLRREAKEVYRVSPYAPGSRPARFSFDFSFNSYPLAFERPGPEVRIYHLPRCKGRFAAT